MALVQPVSDKRCISCNRWHGRRRPGDAPDTVEVASAAVRGVCIEGPWHRSLRGVRSACGQWLRWTALAEGSADERCRFQGGRLTLLPPAKPDNS